MARRGRAGLCGRIYRVSVIRRIRPAHERFVVLAGTGPYGGTRTPRYHRPDCFGTFAGLASAAHERMGRVERSRSGHPEPTVPMTTDLATRVWRLAVVIGPLVAIALTLAAGRRWW